MSLTEGKASRILKVVVTKTSEHVSLNLKYFFMFGFHCSFYSTLNLFVLPEFKWNSFEKSEFEVIFSSMSDFLFVNTYTENVAFVFGMLFSFYATFKSSMLPE